MRIRPKYLESAVAFQDILKINLFSCYVLVPSKFTLLNPIQTRAAGNEFTRYKE